VLFLRLLQENLLTVWWSLDTAIPCDGWYVWIRCFYFMTCNAQCVGRITGLFLNNKFERKVKWGAP